MSTQLEKINKDSVFKYLEPRQEDLLSIIGKGDVNEGVSRIKSEMAFAIQAATKNKQLALSSPQSVAAAIYNTLIVGLTLNPLMELCDLVPYEESKKDAEGNWKTTVSAVMQPRYGGMLKLAADCGAFKDAPFCACVYSGDDFQVTLGSERKIVHNPNYLSDKDEDITHVYCVISLANGGSHIEVMPISKVKAIMVRSQGYKQAVSSKKYNSVWHNFFPQQALKTVLKRALKTVPKSSFKQDAVKLQQAISMDNTDYLLDQPNYKQLNQSQVDKIKAIAEQDSSKIDDIIDSLMAENIDPEQIKEVTGRDVSRDQSDLFTEVEPEKDSQNETNS